MRVVITGSNGFVGKNLVNELLTRYENITIHCLVRRPQESTIPKIKYFTVDYLKPVTLLNVDAFNDIDYIYHVAGVTKSHTAKGFIAGNTTPTENLLQAIVQKKINLKRFVLVSSQAAGGPAETPDHPKTENDPDKPIDAYGKSKRAAEQLLIQEGDKIPYTIIRPGAVYGPYDVDFLNIFKMAQSPFSVFAGVKHKYVSLVYIKDLIPAILNAALSEKTKNRTYYVCDDTPVTWKKIHDTIFKISGRKKIDISLPLAPILLASYLGSLFSVISGKATLFNHQKVIFSRPKYWIASNRRAKQDFNYQSRYHSAVGFKETYAWYKENGWL
jgi:nucleoside-diphosphate-sugar epimerase